MGGSPGGSGGNSSHSGGDKCGGDHPGGRGHGDSHVSDNTRGGFDVRHMIDEIRRVKGTANVNDNDGFPAFSAQLHTLLLVEKFKPLVISKYAMNQEPL
jgi:hypothetical protein